MSGETIIEIPLKWLRTLDRDSYFEMFQEFRGEMDTSMSATFYRMEEIRESLHLPAKYPDFEAFRQAYYRWVRSKLECNATLQEKTETAPTLR